VEGGALGRTPVRPYRSEEDLEDFFEIFSILRNIFSRTGTCKGGWARPMNVFSLEKKICEKAQKYLDAYTNNQLLVKTNQGVLKHV
jgi:hypothetical protein